MRISRKGFVQGAVVVLLAVLAAGHWAYWYRPRVRPAAPDPGDLPASLVIGGEYPVAVWIPFPHQNLGVLASEGSSPQDLARAAAQLAAVDAPTIPHFGPFTAPPSRELVVAADPERGRYLAAARVYPLMSVVARLAGKLARNPWLGGGTIELRKGRVEIRWQGSLWIARTGGIAAPAAAPPAAPPAVRSGLGAPVLALARSDERLDFLPAGWYRLFADGPGRVVERIGGAEAVAVASLDGLFVQALLSESISLAAIEAGDGETRALVLFTGAGEARAEGGFALLSADPARALPLPGLGVAALLGDRGYSGRASGWYLLATSELNFRQGAFLVPALKDGLEARQAGDRPVALALACRPGAALGVLEELARGLEELGPLGEKEGLRLLALRRLLQPIAGSSRLLVAVSEDREHVRLELLP